jgi:hypothetical protein
MYKEGNASNTVNTFSDGFHAQTLRTLYPEPQLLVHIITGRIIVSLN